MNDCLIELASTLTYFPPDGPILTTFAGSLWCVQRTNGCDATYGTIVAASGSATRLCWRDGWHPSNVGSQNTERDPWAHVRRALNAIGWKAQIHSLPDYPMESEHIELLSFAQIHERMVASLNEGMPVIVQGLVGPPEFGVVCGYERNSDKLIGRSYFQTDLGLSNEDYYHVSLPHEPFWAYITLSPGTTIPSLREVGLEMIRATVSQARTESVRGAHTGMAAWRACMDHQENWDRTDYPVHLPKDAREEEWGNCLQGRFMVYCDALMQIHERQFAAGLLRELAEQAPEWACELTEAAELYQQVSCYGGYLWNYLTFDEAGFQKFADAGIRKCLAVEGRRVMALEEQAVQVLEQLLARIW